MSGIGMSDRMDEYHEYLLHNYKYGVDRFFAPTGFLKSFERKTTLSAQASKEAVFAKTVDDAQAALEPVVAGGEGVFDLVAEPGTGKTSVLPFRFPSKRVVVALPTPFDAWSAYNTASGPAKLRLKGLTLGRAEKVCYMDSYMAANMLMSGFMEYDVLIVDECDSGKGVTGFLADVKAPGKVLIRMSASHGRSGGGPSTSFVITDVQSMPDVRVSVTLVSAYVAANAKGRSLVMAPDADTAVAVAATISGAKLLTSKLSLGELSRTMTDKAVDCVFVTDDICARGVNLNLDTVFDCQLVAELGVLRNLTQAELYQRRNRVGRNRPGHYHSPNLPVMDPKISDADVMRSNVVRAFADLPQVGNESARVSVADAGALLMAEEEPYTVQTRAIAEKYASERSSPSPTSSSVDSVSSRRRKSSHRRPSDARSVSSRDSREIKLPSWMLWAATATGKSASDVITVSSKGVHRSSSSSSDEGRSLERIMMPIRARPGLLAPHSHKDVAESAPYAVASRPSRQPDTVAFSAPKAPPIMDLSSSVYELDWPALLGDLMERCSDMPTIVPPHGWVHTTVGGMGSNWLQRPETLAVTEYSFGAAELELVCRAWNTVVAGTWVKRSPGLSAYAHRDQLEFCLRYFQSYFNLAVTG